MATVLKSDWSFHAPPANVDAFVGNRKVYYRSNMEFVTGILATSNGGTGNSKYDDDSVIIYSNGKFISAGVTKKELSVLKDITAGSSGDVSMVDLLKSKVSGIKTNSGDELELDDESNVVLPDYLLKTGGDVSGNLGVKGKFVLGDHIEIKYDSDSKSVVFDVI